MKTKASNETILVLVLTSVYEKIVGSVVKIRLDPSLILEGNNTWVKDGREGGHIRGSMLVSVNSDPQLQNCLTDFNIGWLENNHGGTTVRGIINKTGIPARKFRFHTDDLRWGSVEEM